MVDVNYLRNFSVFSELNDEELKLVYSILKFEEHEVGYEIISDGEKGDTMYLLFEGEVEISKSMTLIKSTFGGVDHADKALIRLKDEWYPCVGEMILFGDDSTRSATVITTKFCKFGVIRKDDFLELSNSNHSIGFKVMKNLALVMGDRLKKANHDILKLTTAFTLALET